MFPIFRFHKTQSSNTFQWLQITLLVPTLPMTLSKILQFGPLDGFLNTTDVLVLILYLHHSVTVVPCPLLNLNRNLTGLIVFSLLDAGILCYVIIVKCS